MYKALIIGFFIVSFVHLNAQESSDSSIKKLLISGNVGVTNNGISIIPTFSLNKPAFNATYSFSRGGRWSLDPDLRMTFDMRKGGVMFWLHYKVSNTGKLRLNVGAHPALNFAIRSVTENGKTWSITQSRRFIGTEIFPHYIVNKHMMFGIYYLKGFGLQKDGPVNSHFVALNSTIAGIPLFGNVTLSLNPQAYYLKLDKEDVFYLSSNITLSKPNSPFALASTMNKEISTKITGSKNFVWNLTLQYHFNKKYTRNNTTSY
jgi:galactose mutarotase-like enzyme